MKQSNSGYPAEYDTKQYQMHGEYSTDIWCTWSPDGRVSLAVSVTIVQLNKNLPFVRQQSEIVVNYDSFLSQAYKVSVHNALRRSTE